MSQFKLSSSSKSEKGEDLVPESERQNVGLDEKSMALLKHLLESKSLKKHFYALQKIYNFVTMSHEKERELRDKCKALQASIEENEKTVKAALKREKDVQLTVDSLHQQLGMSLKEVKEKNAENVKSLETIKKLQEHIGSLSSVKSRDSLKDEKMLSKQDQEGLRDRLKVYEKQIQESKMLQIKWNEEEKKLKKELTKVTKLAEIHKAKLEREKKEKVIIEKEMKNLQEALMQKEADPQEFACSINTKKLQKHVSEEKIKGKMESELQKQEEHIQKLNGIINQREQQMHEMKDEKSFLDQRYLDLRDEYVSIMKLYTETMDDFENRGELEEKFATLRKEHKNVVDAYTVQSKEVASLTQKHNTLVQESYAMRQTMEKELQLNTEEKRILAIEKSNLLTELEKYLILISQYNNIRDNHINTIRKHENKNQELQNQNNSFTLKNYPKQIKEMKLEIAKLQSELECSKNIIDKQKN